ncbi:nucleotide exchange factor Fes1-domain-containing protein [Mrakia frigida]|uniref:Hsp70 nucleotide exchange factor FES1 n=1 Tax=Mrakia frigida TaxID=29902 RepID=UPI003FCBF178
MAAMNELLQWGITNSVPENGDASELHAVAEEIAAGRRKDLMEPGMLEAIMGKSDATLMKEAMTFAVDESKPEEERVIALDNLEMLIEQIDNANNLQSIGLWPPLVALLSSPSDLIRQTASWVCGTAVQNNPKAQEAVRPSLTLPPSSVQISLEPQADFSIPALRSLQFLALNPLPLLLSLIATTSSDFTPPSSIEGLPPLPPSSTETRSRALYALSGTLKHNEEAVKMLDQYEGWGWQVLKGGLSDPSLPLRRKTAFLLSTLLLDVPSTSTPSSTTPAAPLLQSFRSHSLAQTLLSSLTLNSSHPSPGANADEPAALEDADYREKAARVLISLLERGALAEGEKKELAELWKGWESMEGGLEERIWVTGEEEKVVKALLGV